MEEKKNISTDITRKGRGRPKGSKDKTQRKIRKDNTQEIIPEDDRAKIMSHNMELWRLGRIADRNNVALVHDRINTFFCICSKNNILPTVAGLAFALGIDRSTLWDWISNKQGSIKNPEVIDLLKNVYSMINTQYEELLTQGKMVPVSAFFLMQNNHGYKQQTDHVITATTEQPLNIEDVTSRAGLLEDE